MRTGWQVLDWVQFALGALNIVIGLFTLASADSAIILMFLGVFMCLLPMARRNAFNHGWMSGRVRMVNALQESAHRGHTLEEWLILEAERDLASLPASYRRRLQQ